MSKRVYVLLVSAVVSVACGGTRGSSAPSPSAPPINSRAALVRTIDSMVSAREFRTAMWGVFIVDPESHDTLYRHNAEKLFIPASNEKILTSSVMLEQLGPDYRFRTMFAARGAIANGTLNGDLAVVGRGDPTISDHMQRDAMIPLQEYVDRVRAQVAKMQGMGGADAEWVLDGAAAMTPGDAATVAKALEKVHMIWFDEPTAVLTTDGLAKITDESVMPIGLGRRIHEIPAFQDLLRHASVNVLRPGLGLNSLTKIKRIAALAETHYVAVAPYHEGGPIGAMAGVHLAAALANSYSVDVPAPAADRDAAMRAELTSGNKEAAENGFAVLMNRPGLGFEVNRKALDAYSEERI